MKTSVNVILATEKTIRIIYPSKETVFNGKRSLARHAIHRWYGQLSSDLNNKTYLSDLISKQNDQIFLPSQCTSNTARKIQSIDENLGLAEFFIGGQILIPCYERMADKIYLHDREMQLDYLGDYLLSEVLKQINTLDLKQYGSNTILLSVNII